MRRSPYHGGTDLRETERAEPEPVISEQIVAAIKSLERRGRLTPDQVVEAARNPRSPLHGRFEWDDSAAAAKWRIEQARELIRTIKVVITIEDREIRVPRYTRDQAAEGDEQGYSSLERTLAEPANAANLISYEFGRSITCLNRAADIAEAMNLPACKGPIARAASELANVGERVERLAKRRGKVSK